MATITTMPCPHCNADIRLPIGSDCPVCLKRLPGILRGLTAFYVAGRPGGSGAISFNGDSDSVPIALEPEADTPTIVTN